MFLARDGPSCGRLGPVWVVWSTTTLIPYSLLIVASAQADVAGQPSTVLGNETLMKLCT